MGKGAHFFALKRPLLHSAMFIHLLSHTLPLLVVAVNEHEPVFATQIREVSADVLRRRLMFLHHEASTRKPFCSVESRSCWPEAQHYRQNSATLA